MVALGAHATVTSMAYTRSPTRVGLTSPIPDGRTLMLELAPAASAVAVAAGGA